MSKFGLQAWLSLHLALNWPAVTQAQAMQPTRLADWHCSQSEAQKMIPVINRELKLDLSLNLQAMIQKDFQQPPAFLRQRMQQGWQWAQEPRWTEEHFSEVFHAWFYLRIAQTQGLKLSNLLQIPEAEFQQKWLALEATIDKELASLRIQVSSAQREDILSPVLKPHSGQKLHYQIKLEDFTQRKTLPTGSNNYRYLFRASASQASLIQHEQWALGTLLELPGSQLAATAVWRHYGQYLKQGKPAEHAFYQAAQAVENKLQRLHTQGIFHSEILSVINWDTGFRPEEVFFLSGNYATTALYGSVIFLAEQQQPRGIALNEWGVITRFYQSLPYHWLLSQRGFWLFSVADKAEYVLPAYLDHAEIFGVDVRAEREAFSPEATRTGKPGPLLRKYRKYYDAEQKQLFVFVLNAKNEWIGSFYRTESARPVHIPVHDWALSSDTLPADLLNALPRNSYYVAASDTRH